MKIITIQKLMLEGTCPGGEYESRGGKILKCPQQKRKVYLNNPAIYNKENIIYDNKGKMEIVNFSKLDDLYMPCPRCKNEIKLFPIPSIHEKPEYRIITDITTIKE